MSEAFRDRVYGCIIAGAVGDALAAPVEGWSYNRIREEYGKIDEFKQYYMPYAKSEPGAVTSDTTLRHYLSLALIEKGGRVTPREFADFLCEHLNSDRVGINEVVIVENLSAGINPRDAGRGSIPDNHMTSGITPVGIVNAGNPQQAYQDGYALASIFQDRYYRDATATVAAGIAAAFAPDATVDDVLETMAQETDSVLFRAIDMTMALAERCDTVDSFVEEFYDSRLDWRWPSVQWNRERYEQGEVFSASPFECVPVAMAILSLCNENVDRTIIEGVNFGRDSDAITTIAGSIAGALSGAQNVRDEWIEQCERANTDLFQELEGDEDANFASVADRLVNVVRSEREAAAARAELLDEITEQPNSVN